MNQEEKDIINKLLDPENKARRKKEWEKIKAELEKDMQENPEEYKNALTGYDLLSLLIAEENGDQEAKNKLNELRSNEELNELLKTYEEFIELQNTLPDILKAPWYKEKLINKFNDNIEFSKELEPVLKPYTELPSSPMLYFIKNFLAHNGKKRQIETNSNGRRLDDRHKEIIYYNDEENKNGFNVKSFNHQTKESLDIAITNPEILKIGKSTRKMFTFLLIKSNEQNFKTEIIFNLNELIQNGMYTSLVSARTGVKNALNSLQTISIGGTIKKGNKEIHTSRRILFPGYEINNNVVSVQFNEKFNIEFIAPYFALLPSFIFSLNNNAFALCEYIFLQARQNGKYIKEKGSFNINLEKIRQILALPNPDETQKHKQYIKDPILEAIAGIQKEAEKLNDFKITLEDNNKTIKEWLTGFITVTILNKNLKENYIKIVNSKEEKIKKIIADKQKREEKKKQKTETF